MGIQVLCRTGSSKWNILLCNSSYLILGSLIHLSCLINSQGNRDYTMYLCLYGQTVLHDPYWAISWCRGELLPSKLWLNTIFFVFTCIYSRNCWNCTSSSVKLSTLFHWKYQTFSSQHQVKAITFNFLMQDSFKFQSSAAFLWNGS